MRKGAKFLILERVSKSPAVFDLQRLNWFNSHYLRSLPIELITERSLPYLTSVDHFDYTDKQLQEIIGSVRDGLTTLSQILAATKFYFVKTPEISQELKSTVLSQEQAKTVMKQTLQELDKFPYGDHKGCKQIIDNMGKELSVKGKDLYWPLRAALSGAIQGRI